LDEDNEPSTCSHLSPLHVLCWFWAFAGVLEGTSGSLIWWKEGWGREETQEMVWKTEGFIGYSRKSLLDFKGKELSCQIV